MAESACEVRANRWRKNTFKIWCLLLFDSPDLPNCLSAKLEIHTYGKSIKFSLKRTMEQIVLCNY